LILTSYLTHHCEYEPFPQSLALVLTANTNIKMLRCLQKKHRLGHTNQAHNQIRLLCKVKNDTQLTLQTAVPPCQQDSHTCSWTRNVKPCITKY